MPSSKLSTQLAPVQCCTCCTSIVADCNINLSNVSVAEKNCQVCALLLCAVKRHCNDDELNVQIVREGSALKIGGKGPRILRLCSDSGYYLQLICSRQSHYLLHIATTERSADTGQDLQISFPVLPEAENPARFALLRAWLDWCDKSHDCNECDTKSKVALPTRLLYVGDPNPDVLRLYCPKKNNRVKYVALSHCWGKLTDENKRQFCTTNDNIKARINGFSFSELPRTFRDAVRVTRELGIQYLWIDSLCIIQWNKKDWEHESKRMEGVFTSAYCTIAATSVVNSDTGFLERNISSDYIYIQDASGRPFYVCTDIDDFDNHVEKARLNTRAWAMQERVLSRRTIHFSANQTYFECGEGVYCENMTRLKR